MISESLNRLDWILFLLCLLLSFISLAYGHFRKKQQGNSLLDYLVMGRQLTTPLFVATLVSTWYGGIFGVTQISFESGIYNFVTQGLFWYVSYIVFALFLVDRISQYKAITLPNLIEKMFGPRSAKLAAWMNFFNVLPIAYVISLGLFLQVLFGGSLLLWTSIGAFVVVLYSAKGGLRSVVYTDIVQFVIMVLAVISVIAFSVFEYGGIGYLRSNLPESHFSPTGGNSLATTLVWGFIALSTLVDPNFYQRVFSAKSSRVAKRGILISTLVWFVFDICTTLGGMYARAAMPEVDASQSYLLYSMQVLPAGFRGFLLAGVLATVLSTLDSYLFLAGATLSYDLAPEKYKNKSWPKTLAVFVVACLAIALSNFFEGDIELVWKTLGSYSAACLLFPVLMGYLFVGRISDNSFFFSCLYGILGTTFWKLSPLKGFWQNVDALYVGVLCTSISLLFLTRGFSNENKTLK